MWERVGQAREYRILYIQGYESVRETIPPTRLLNITITYTYDYLLLSTQFVAISTQFVLIRYSYNRYNR